MKFTCKSHNKAVLSPSAGTAIPLALHVSPKPRRYTMAVLSQLTTQSGRWFLGWVSVKIAGK
tara:strand:- start:5843 stop:6028 length:186 start_codon:yes stop_codon:yes gene_type:complete